MKILYVGDVMAAPGRKVLDKVLSKFKKELKVDLVIVQAENSDDHGKSPHPKDVKEMLAAGADFFTGGNHSFTNKETEVLYQNRSPIIRPANVKEKTGEGYRVIEKAGHKVLVASILGQTVGRQHIEPTHPLEAIDRILASPEAQEATIKIVNFHGDFSSEKRVFGYYLDGRVSAVVGDHWHVPSADAMVLPNGTAHITDVGMCGTVHSSIGVKTDAIIDRWKTGRLNRNLIEEGGPLQFNAVLIDVNDKTGLAKSIKLIQRAID